MADTRIQDNTGRKGTMSAPIDDKGTRRVTLAGGRTRLYTASQVKRFLKP